MIIYVIATTGVQTMVEKIAKIWTWFLAIVILMAGMGIGASGGVLYMQREAVAHDSGYYQPKTAQFTFGTPEGIAVSGLMPDVTYREIPQVKPKVTK